MPGIRNLTAQEFQERLIRFKKSYVKDWDEWIDSFTNNTDVAYVFGEILRRWQACRPNNMRRSQRENFHEPPYLEHILQQSDTYINSLSTFDLRNDNAFCATTEYSLKKLWDIFTNLSYCGKARNGKTGVVGISKAVLLLTEGRVGPAFDSKVRNNLGKDSIDNANSGLTH